MERYEFERTNSIYNAVSIAALKMGVPLFVVFWCCDWLFAPKLAWTFLLLRLSVLPVSAFVLFWVKKDSSLRVAKFGMYLLVLSYSICISVMIFMTGGPSSPYYAGLNLVCIGTIMLVPWTIKEAILTVLMTYSSLLIMVVFSFFEYKLNWHDLAIVNLFFAFSTIVISLLSRSYMNGMRRRELAFKIALENEVDSRQKLIEIKVQEAISLRGLSQQHSPQVVRAIQEGRIHLDGKVNSSSICAIFVDIANSTERIVRLDKDSVLKVINRFMNTVADVMVRFDITVDKFLGDGMLGFCNEPYRFPDYVERVALCASKIIDEIKLDRDFYLDNWHDELQIRVGIAMGYASVGFFGGSSMFRSYTAIGPVVNLASRLCSRAEPNGIVVSNEVKQVLEKDSRYELTSLGVITLRGFEADKIKAFSMKLMLSAGSDAETSFGVEHCDKCGERLSLQTNSKGHYYFGCSNCSTIKNIFDQNHLDYNISVKPENS